MFITANTASQISWRKQHSLKERLALFKQSLQVLLQVPVSKVAACIIAEKPFDWIQRLLDALFVHNGDGHRFRAERPHRPRHELRRHHDGRARHTGHGHGKGRLLEPDLGQ